MTRHITHPKSLLLWGRLLLPWIMVGVAMFICSSLFFGDVVSPIDYQQAENVCITYTHAPADLQLNKRQFWFLSELAKGEKLKRFHLATHWEISMKTSQRDIEVLRKHNFIEYVGSLKTGYYKIKQQKNSSVHHK